MLQLSKTLSGKYGAGFSKSNLLKMRRFYLLNQKESVTTQLDWTDYVELLPVKIVLGYLQDALDGDSHEQVTPGTLKSAVK